MSGVILREAPTLWAGGGLSLIGAARPPCRRLRRNLEQKQNNQAIKVLFLGMIMLLIMIVNAGICLNNKLALGGIRRGDSIGEGIRRKIF